MLTGEIRSQIDSIWNDFWSGGVSNPLSVIEQITYLLFIKRLGELRLVAARSRRRLNEACYGVTLRTGIVAFHSNDGRTDCKREWPRDKDWCAGWPNGSTQ